MNMVRWLVGGVALMAAVAAPAGLSAQVPPHVPGTVCLTPTFWCNLAPPQAVGSPCVCATPSGQVHGVAG